MPQDDDIETTRQTRLLRGLREADRDRFALSLIADPADRPDLVAVFAFAAEIARIPATVREPQVGLIRLQWWRDQILGTGVQAPERGAPDLVYAIRNALLRHRGLDTLLDTILIARERDLERAPFADLAALEAYGAATQGPVLQAGLRVLGVDDAGHDELSRRIAAIYALQGMVRAFAVLAREGRLSLPVDALAAGGGTVERALSGRAPDAVRYAVRAVAGRAETLVAELRDPVAGNPPGRFGTTQTGSAAIGRAVPVLSHLSLAEGYLRAIGRAGYDPLDVSLQRPRTRPLRLLLNRWRQRF